MPWLAGEEAKNKNSRVLALKQNGCSSCRSPAIGRFLQLATQQKNTANLRGMLRPEHSFQLHQVSQFGCMYSGSTTHIAGYAAPLLALPSVTFSTLPVTSDLEAPLFGQVSPIAIQSKHTLTLREAPPNQLQIPLTSQQKPQQDSDSSIFHPDGSLANQSEVTTPLSPLLPKGCQFTLLFHHNVNLVRTTPIGTIANSEGIPTIVPIGVVGANSWLHDLTSLTSSGHDYLRPAIPFLHFHLSTRDVALRHRHTVSRPVAVCCSCNLAGHAHLAQPSSHIEVNHCHQQCLWCAESYFKSLYLHHCKIDSPIISRDINLPLRVTS